MKIKLDILRRKNQNEQPYHQIIEYEIQDENTTLAAALTDINSRSDIKDMEGKPVGKIRWECSCMQKKCGACAMVINSVPRLACDTKLSEFQKKGKVTVEPLRKFPVIADLAVDRSILFENLKTLKMWFEEETTVNEQSIETSYEASRCLQCGCCLEVCPNFCADTVFKGMAAIVPASRLIASLPDVQKKEFFKTYRKNMYEGCGKSLACRNICPAGINIEKLLVNSNAAAVWKIPPLRKKRRT